LFLWGVYSRNIIPNTNKIILFCFLIIVYNMVRKTKKKKYQKNTKKARMSLRKRGGKVVGEGAYGCVYRPPIPCKGSTQRPKNTVSKLMNEDDAVKEIQEISHIERLTKNIPNSNLYFTINDIKICKPNWKVFKDDDLVGRCNILNNSIDYRNLSILQLPDAGTYSVDNYLLKHKFNDAVGFSKFTKNMLNLLINGIIPLNELGGYHNDIKGDNIMVRDNIPRLIDWGLSYVSNTGKVINANRRGETMGSSNEVQKEPMRALIMFNSPISAPFFFKTAWELEKTGTPRDINYNTYLNTVPKFLSSDGHFRFFVNIINVASKHFRLTNPNNVFILSYLNKLRTNYIVNGVLNYDMFYADWHHNVDIWGWILSFSKILFINRPITINDEQWKTIQKTISKLILYTITDGAIRLDVEKIIKILKPILDINDVDIYSPSSSFLEREQKYSPSSSYDMINSASASASPSNSDIMFKEEKLSYAKKTQNKLYNTLKNFRMPWKRKNMTKKK
jgi:hypothetical protein